VRALESWQAELKRMVLTIIAGSVFAIGLQHLNAALGIGFQMFGGEGTIPNLVQALVLMPAAIMWQRSINVPKSPRLDEAMTMAIRERAVDNLIEAQRENQGGPA
jgi:hypothetical protein